MVEVYAKRFSLDTGAGTVNSRWVIGASIIKRNLGHIYKMLDMVDERAVPLSQKYPR